MHKKKRVLIVFPGVTGCSGANYVKEMLKAAHREGYQGVVLNGHFAKDPEDHKADYRVLDFSDSKIIRSSIDKIHECLGEDAEIYAVGFSLGANHLLRYLGAHHHDSGIKAAVSVSNPFDVLATTINLKHRAFGIYDKVIRYKLSKPFAE